ncbi:hypothetical protein [Paraburkholderia sp. RL17-337-BIB-A]
MGFQVFSAQATHERPTLAQVIHAVLWELSYGGDPEQAAELVQTVLDSAS